MKCPSATLCLSVLLVVAPLLTSAQSLRHTIDSLRVELAKAKADTTRARLLGELGSWYFSIRADSALLLGRQAVDLARKTGDLKLELTCRRFLALTVGEQNIPESMRMYFAVLQEAERFGYRWIIQNCYYDMGILQLYLENYPQTITYLKRARQLALEDGSFKIGAFLASEMGSAFRMVHQADSSRYYFAVAIREDPALEKDPYILYYRGDVENEANPTKARTYFQRSIRTFNALQDWRGLALASRWYSEFLWKQHQPDSSILVAKQGLQAAQRVGILRPVLNNSRQLAQVYQMLGQTDSAYKYQTIMLSARDSLFSQQKINRIQTTLIDEQQRIQILQDEKNRFESNVKIHGLLGLVLVVLGVAGALYRNDRQKQRTNQQLQKLNQAISEQKEEILSQRDHLQQTLTELKLTQNQLIQKEKLASLGELTAGIAHEIQNPLNFVNNFSELSVDLAQELQEEAEKPDSDKELIIDLVKDLSQNQEKISHHGKRASSIVKGMLEHSRQSTGERTLTDINQLADEYLRLSYHGIRAKNSNFNSDYKTDFDKNLPKIEVIPQDIGRILLNLINNAFWAVKTVEKPLVVVKTEHTDNQIIIKVKDNGTGIPETIKAKIFQPFFTTKPTGEGTGLGLSLAYDIVTKGHGGTIEAESAEGVGTTFIVKLPIT